MKKKWWLVVLVLVLVGIGIGGYTLYQRMSSQGVAQNGAAVATETAIVERGTLRVTVDGAGSLEPEDEMALSFSTGGKVAEVLVDVGDAVEAGDVIARLDDTDTQQAVAEAELQVEQSEISLASAKIDAESGMAQSNLDAAQADYERVVANVAHTGDQLASAWINLKQARESLADAQDNYDTAYDPDRDWELNDRFRSSLLENEREAATRNLEKAKDSLTVAQANYNLAVIGIDESSTLDAQIKVLNAQTALDKDPIQLQQAQLSLEQALFKLATAQRNLDNTVLVAPADGTIIALDVQVGQMVGSGQSVGTLADLTVLVVEIGLDEGDIVGVSLEQAAIVTLDAFDDVELAGRITHIAPTAQSQSGVVLYPVTITLDPTGLPVRAGMTADVEIVISSADSVLLVPLKAVRSVGGDSFILRKLKAGEQPTALPGAEQQQMMTQGFTAVPVTLGMITDTYAEVVDGLEEGDIVSVSSSTPASNSNGFSGPGMGFMGGDRP